MKKLTRFGMMFYLKDKSYLYERSTIGYSMFMSYYIQISGYFDDMHNEVAHFKFQNKQNYYI